MSEHLDKTSKLAHTDILELDWCIILLVENLIDEVLLKYLL